MHIPLAHALAAAGASAINPPPDPSGLPGSNQLLTLLSGLRWVCLFACVAVIGVGALTWSFASHGSNPYYTSHLHLASEPALACLFVDRCQDFRASTN